MLNLKAYCDPGFSPNEQTTYLYMMNIQNCYEADGWTVLAGRALTNTPANTFCRAPGNLILYNVGYMHQKILIGIQKSHRDECHIITIQIFNFKIKLCKKFGSNNLFVDSICIPN